MGIHARERHDLFRCGALRAARALPIDPETWEFSCTPRKPGH
jgi:hypothetical protein